MHIVQKLKNRFLPSLGPAKTKSALITHLLGLDHIIYLHLLVI